MEYTATLGFCSWSVELTPLCLCTLQASSLQSAGERERGEGMVGPHEVRRQTQELEIEGGKEKEREWGRLEETDNQWVATSATTLAVPT